MSAPPDLSQLVSELTSDLESRFQSLRDDLARKLHEALGKVSESARSEATAAAPPATPGTRPTDILFAATANIQDATSQADILRLLLDGAEQFSGRSILFVLRNSALAPWQSRGFANEGAVKSLQVKSGEGLAGRAIQDKMPVAAAAAEFSSDLVAAHGNPVDGNAWVLPLIVKEKVAALVYADAGAGAETAARFDASALQLLVRSTAGWLELLALRKTAGADSSDTAPTASVSGAPSAMAAAAPIPVPEVATPAPHMEPPASTMESSQPVATESFAQSISPPVQPAPSAPPAPPADATLAGLPPEEQEVHKKAKRFAKLLVDEIKLYNQAKVAEGRQNKDIYFRLRDDIDKSRATYEKRYGSTVAGQAHYFEQEVVRILAEGDAGMMGPSFTQ